MTNTVAHVKYKTIQQLLDILDSLNPAAAESERQALGMTVPADSRDYSDAVMDILDAIEENE